MKKYAVHLLCALCLWLVPSTSWGADPIAVIVHPDNPIERLERGDLRPIFQTSKTNWNHDGGILALNLAETSDTRQDFDRAVLGLDPERVARYWIDRKIRGGARPPRRIPSAQAAVTVVGKKANAIGYVRVRDLAQMGKAGKAVKVVARIAGDEVLAP